MRDNDLLSATTKKKMDAQIDISLLVAQAREIRNANTRI